MNNKALIVLQLAALLIAGCSNSEINQGNHSEVFDRVLNSMNDRLTEATIAGTLSPPAAARCFAYANIGAYEAAVIGDTSKQSIFTTLQSNGLDLDDVDADRYINLLGTVKVFSLLAREGVYHPQLISDLERNLLDSLSQGFDSDDIQYTLSVSDDLGNRLLSWMRSDGYSEMRKMPRYELIDEEWAWEPTPPKYTEALDPFWHQLRTFVLDSSSAYRPKLKVEFSSNEDSEFYRFAKEVQKRTVSINREELEVANFWDCNPYLTKREGHSIRAIRQMSPGAHWVGLTRQACSEQNLTFTESAFVTAVVAIALHDAFISVWETKYHYNLIRPETYINRYIDPKWRPTLETPHFPEYTSGHSVISAAAAAVLENRLGENYAFTDSLEVPFGKAPRQFEGFKEAANEAAMSRLLGGIHYRFANEDGVVQGEKVGEAVIEKLLSD